MSLRSARRKKHTPERIKSPYQKMLTKFLSDNLEKFGKTLLLFISVNLILSQ